MSDESDGSPDIGSLADEATKLFGALSEWARDHAGEAGDGLSGPAGQTAALAQDLNDHLATGSAECTACPVCRALDAVRQLSPEVKSHLVSAMTSLGQAAAAILTKTDPRAEAHSHIEHIDLGDDGFED